MSLKGWEVQICLNVSCLICKCMCINLYISSKCILLARCIRCLVKSVELKAFFASYVKHDSESMLTSNDIEYNKV